MPLHEYLERKRHQNTSKYNATGACHICGSTGRNKDGFSHFMDNEAAAAAVAAGGGNGYSNENSMVAPPNLAAMRVCACFGSDWPHSLRVCDKCIEDDKTIGRIRSCGVCGTVACDENCGTELLECTDDVKWNNQGCLECRGCSDFSELDVFSKKNVPPQNYGEPRITRICTKCLEQSTPWVRYDFVCRKFRCGTRLVPSDIAERKRFCSFGSSPLNLLPEDGLVAVVDFLSGSDLKQLFLTCSAMCTVAERVAKEKVERVSDFYPTGPIVITKRVDGNGQPKSWTYFEGRNDFGLRAPDDQKSWVGAYHYLEKVTKEMFHFDFQLIGSAGPGGDREVVGRFINSGSDKFAFGRTYTKNEDNLIPNPPSFDNSCMVRGGCVLVTANETAAPITIASNEPLLSGTHRVICRLFCPGSGGARSNRDVNSHKLGSIGIMRTNQPGADGPTNTWAQRADISEGWVKEEVVVGISYNANDRQLVIHSNSHIHSNTRYSTNQYTLDEAAGELYIAAELMTKSVNVAQTLLTAREVSEDEWERFLSHTTEGRGVTTAVNEHRDAVEAFQRIEAMEAFAMNVDGEGNAAADGNPELPELRHRVLRQAMRNRRRGRDAEGEGDEDGNNLQRVQVRAMLPARMPGRADENAAALANDEAVNDGDDGVPELQVRERPLFARNMIQRARQAVRAVRPARAVFMPVREHNDNILNGINNAEDEREMLARDMEVLFDEGAQLMAMDEDVAMGEFHQQAEMQQGLWPEEAEADHHNEEPRNAD